MNIYPLYLKMKVNAIKGLVNKDFSIFQETNNSITFVNKDNFFISLINQGYDYPQTYFGKTYNLNDMISLDFSVELFLTGKIELTDNCNKRNGFYDFTYDLDLLENYYSNFYDIDLLKYQEWERDNFDKILLIADKLYNSRDEGKRIV